MPYFAHSGRSAREGRPAVAPQPYAEHVTGVAQTALRHARDMVRFLADEGVRSGTDAGPPRVSWRTPTGPARPKDVLNPTESNKPIPNRCAIA